MPRRLGELEDAVMTRVWEWNRPVTVRDVLEDLQQNRSIAYTTVMTVLDNLRQKGWVRRNQDGRAYRYEAVSTRAAYSAALMHEAWAESDNPAAALVAFFGMMSADQTAALRDALRVADVPDDRPTGSEPRRSPAGDQSGSAPDTSGNPGTQPAAGVPRDSPEGVPNGPATPGSASSPSGPAGEGTPAPG